MPLVSEITRDDEAYGSYINLARHISEVFKKGMPIEPIFSTLICATEKEDGSNLGIRVSKVSNEWRLISLLGRSSKIWDTDLTQPENLSSASIIKYGNGGALGTLPNMMKSYVVILAEILNVSDIIVYGEVWRKNSKFPSWHPFAYKIPNNNGEWILNRLTSKVHAIFSTVSQKFGVPVEFFSTPENLRNALSKNVFIAPPPIMFVGTLKGAIDTMYQKMMINTVEFEGVFIVFEDGTDGFKWKTGAHEEQPYILTSVQLNLDSTSPDAFNCYKKIEDVYGTRSKELSAKMIRSKQAAEHKNTLETMSSQLKDDIDKAIERVVSKMVSWENIDNRDRINMIDNVFLPAVVTDVKKKYTESDLEIPFDENIIVSESLRQLKPVVMKVKYIPKKESVVIV